MAKSEFIVTVVVETKKKMSLKEMDKVAKWLKKGLTVDEATYERWPITNHLYDFPKANHVATVGSMKDWDTMFAKKGRK